MPPAAALVFPGSPALQALQDATVRTHLANYVTVPTDCP
jgi:hypothetical protein